MLIFRLLLSLSASIAWMYSMRTWFITPINPSDFPRFGLGGLLASSIMGLFPLLFLDGIVALLRIAWMQGRVARNLCASCGTPAIADQPCPSCNSNPTLIEPARPCITLLNAWPVCLILGLAIDHLIAAAEERAFIASSKQYFAANPDESSRFQPRLWPFEGTGMGIDRNCRTWTNDRRGVST